MVGAGRRWERQAAGLIRATGNANDRSSAAPDRLDALGERVADHVAHEGIEVGAPPACFGNEQPMDRLGHPEVDELAAAIPLGLALAEGDVRDDPLGERCPRHACSIARTARRMIRRRTSGILCR